VLLLLLHLRVLLLLLLLLLASEGLLCGLLACRLSILLLLLLLHLTVLLLLLLLLLHLRLLLLLVLSWPATTLPFAQPLLHLSSAARSCWLGFGKLFLLLLILLLLLLLLLVVVVLVVCSPLYTPCLSHHLQLGSPGPHESSCRQQG
jgi:hypothetical protein